MQSRGSSGLRSSPYGFLVQILFLCDEVEVGLRVTSWHGSCIQNAGFSKTLQKFFFFSKNPNDYVWNELQVSIYLLTERTGEQRTGRKESGIYWVPIMWITKHLEMS